MPQSIISFGFLSAVLPDSTKFRNGSFSVAIDGVYVRCVLDEICCELLTMFAFVIGISLAVTLEVIVFEFTFTFDRTMVNMELPILVDTGVYEWLIS